MTGLRIHLWTLQGLTSALGHRPSLGKICAELADFRQNDHVKTRQDKTTKKNKREQYRKTVKNKSLSRTSQRRKQQEWCRLRCKPVALMYVCTHVHLFFFSSQRFVCCAWPANPQAGWRFQRIRGGTISTQKRRQEGREGGKRRRDFYQNWVDRDTSSANSIRNLGSSANEISLCNKKKLPANKTIQCAPGNNQWGRRYQDMPTETMYVFTSSWFVIGEGDRARDPCLFFFFFSFACGHSTRPDREGRKLRLNHVFNERWEISLNEGKKNKKNNWIIKWAQIKSERVNICIYRKRGGGGQRERLQAHLRNMYENDTVIHTLFTANVKKTTTKTVYSLLFLKNESWPDISAAWYLLLFYMTSQ